MDKHLRTYARALMHTPSRILQEMADTTRSERVRSACEIALVGYSSICADAHLDDLREALKGN